MKPLLFIATCIALFCCAFISQTPDVGKPWQNKMQQLPGKLECELYNIGGEGAAYHDSDSTNNGSGKT